MICGLVAWISQANALAFTVGDRLQANATVNVRQTPAGTVSGTQASGSQGAIIGGPTTASLNGTTYTWWNIDFSSGADGWVADIGLVSAPPTVQTLAAASITTTGALVRGSINPNGSSTSAYFEYGLTASYGSTTASGNFGTTAQTIGYTISGLSPNTTYHYRIVASNGTGTSRGGDMTFTTSGQSPPTVQTLAASSITTTGAQLNGSINPNGSSTTAYFEYGTTTSYGSTSASGNFGTTVQNIGFSVTGLSPTTTYHFRIVASNSGGTSRGSDMTFTTSTQPASAVQTLAATSVTNTSARVNGFIDPKGSSTTAYFEYGTTAAYGSTTISGNFGTTAQNIGTTISGLTPGTTYHYRIVASNSGGTSRGSDMTFTTSTQSAPTVQTLAASAVTNTSAQLNGSINPNGANTTAYFEYGTTVSYGSKTVSGNFGTTAQNIGTTASGLSPGTTYHYRVVAYNSGGTNRGVDITFTTTTAPQTGPIVQTLPATLQTATSAQLNGYLNPNGFNSAAYFQYGTSTSYGNTTPSGNFGTTPQNIGYSVSGLTPGTTYHYRIVASNTKGVSYGLDSSFTLSAAPGSTPPTILSQPQGQTVQAGANVTFTVGVTGTMPLSYQWRRNGAALPGKTGSTLTLNSVGPFDSDGYSVVVNNAFGTTTSALAWLAVYQAPTNSPPPAPIVVPTNRPPVEPVLIPVTDTQLGVFSGSGFATGGAIDPAKMTVVFTHGWNSNPEGWAEAMASNMVAGGVSNANLLAWDWHQAADTGPFLSRAFSATPRQGHKLGQALATTLGSGYGKPIHFIGHSLGTLVNAAAANYLHEHAFDSAKTHVTLLDDAELANVENIIVVFGSTVVPALEPLLGQSQIPTVGWASPLPHRRGWVDNYVSLVGGRHPEAVNVFLNQGIDRASRDNLIKFLEDAHGYGCAWYGATANQPSISILGNRYSFERLGINTSPAQACPYPLDSLFVQDNYPSGEYSLHQPTALEFDVLMRRQSAALVGYGFLAGIDSLDDIGQTIGDAYLDVIVSSAAVVSDASTVASKIFYSLRAVLNSASGGQSQLASRRGLSPHGPDSGSEPPGIWLPVAVPTNAIVLSFDFTFTGNAGNDVLTTAIGGTNVFALEAQFIPQNQKLNSGAIPVVRWAGQNVELFLGLVGGSSSNATVTIDALRFYQLVPPNLSISISGNAAVISWPVSGQGYVLEYANTLTGTNSWNAVTNTPVASGLWNVVTNPIAGERAFYRLRK
jgi:pimeloyl-ACP methyl ester carboxylesterase